MLGPHFQSLVASRTITLSAQLNYAFKKAFPAAHCILCGIFFPEYTSCTSERRRINADRTATQSKVKRIEYK